MLPELIRTDEQETIDWQHRPTVNHYLQSLSVQERVDILKDIITQCPKDAFLFGHYGKSLLAINNPLQAIDYLQKATESETSDASLFFNLGLAYQQMQRMSLAIGSLQKAVDIAANADHILMLSRFAQECGQLKLALSAAQLGMKIHERDDRFSCTYANALVLDGKPELALEWIAVNDSGESANLSKIQYNIYNALGHTEQASVAQREFQRRTIRQQATYRNNANNVLNSIPNASLRARLAEQWEAMLTSLTAETSIDSSAQTQQFPAST